MIMENYGGILGKIPDSSTRALWPSYQKNLLVAKQEYLAKEITNLGLGIIFGHSSKGSVTCEISSSHGGEYDVQSCLLGYTAV
jgi:hypothetical protein